MFFQGSRYANAGTVTMTRADGVIVTVTKLPLPTQKPLQGFHRRLDGQRLDLIASRYLKDATAFWQLCDANNSMIPGALAAHNQVGIPVES